VLLIGIDEAGYGPLLGPLCHGFAAIRVNDPPDGAPPNLWKALRPAVARAGAKRALAIDDSKKVYQSGKNLRGLERGVFAFLTCSQPSQPVSRIDLQTLLPDMDLSELARDAWLDNIDPPAYDETFKADRLQNALARIGAQVVTVGARAVSARAFNVSIENGANKAEANWRVTAYELARLRAMSLPGECIFAAIDRQGGRKFYASLLCEIFQTALVEVLCEKNEASIYRFEDNGREVRVGFFVSAESQHLPVALASMAAKLAREKYMERMNAFFQRHQPGLKRTAGYYRDARRFISETALLRKQLNIDNREFIRVR
jgi:ribonuclease HII